MFAKLKRVRDCLDSFTRVQLHAGGFDTINNSLDARRVLTTRQVKQGSGPGLLTIRRKCETLVRRLESA